MAILNQNRPPMQGDCHRVSRKAAPLPMRLTERAFALPICLRRTSAVAR